MAVLLTATGLFVYFRLESELDTAITDNLRARADEVTALVSQSESGLRESRRSRLSEQEESFAQILAADGRVVDSPPGARGSALSAAELQRARQRTILVDHASVPGVSENGVRLLATPLRAQNRDLVAVVGASLEDRNDALGSVRRLLLIGGPAALLLASLAGYGVASASLRPVERMRRRAAAVSASEPGHRLPVSRANDEIGRLGQTLNAMLARLESALNRERSFVSDASHELRTPLAVLKTELDLAMRSGRSVDELEAAVRSAIEETDRLVQLAEDLLVIARSDQGKLPVRLTDVEVTQVLADVRERFAVRSRQMNRPLVADPANGIRLTADPLRLRQALGNMVDNALRYGRGTVRLSAKASNGEVELHVRDEGPGFPEQFLQSAFERFSRADDGRARGGTGLGLAIVEAIASAHRGRADAANRRDGGADVWLTLPARQS